MIQEWWCVTKGNMVSVHSAPPPLASLDACHSSTVADLPPAAFSHQPQDGEVCQAYYGKKGALDVSTRAACLCAAAAAAAAAAADDDDDDARKAMTPLENPLASHSHSLYACLRPMNPTMPARAGRGDGSSHEPEQEGDGEDAPTVLPQIPQQRAGGWWVVGGWVGGW